MDTFLTCCNEAIHRPRAIYLYAAAHHRAQHLPSTCSYHAHAALSIHSGPGENALAIYRGAERPKQRRPTALSSAPGNRRHALHAVLPAILGKSFDTVWAPTHREQLNDSSGDATAGAQHSNRPGSQLSRLAPP